MPQLNPTAIPTAIADIQDPLVFLIPEFVTHTPRAQLYKVQAEARAGALGVLVEKSGVVSSPRGRVLHVVYVFSVPWDTGLPRGPPD